MPDEELRPTPRREREEPTLWYAIAFEGALIPVAVGLAFLVGVRPWERLWVDAGHLAIGLAGVLPMLLLFVGLWKTSASWAREIHRRIEELILPLFERAPLFGTAIVSLLAGVGEELLFRGVIQDALVEPVGLWPALALASVIFGLLHWITPAYGLIATLVGAYLGAIYIWTGNLLAPIVIHALYDFVILQVYLWRSASFEAGLS